MKKLKSRLFKWLVNTIFKADAKDYVFANTKREMPKYIEVETTRSDYEVIPIEGEMRVDTSRYKAHGLTNEQINDEIDYKIRQLKNNIASKIVDDYLEAEKLDRNYGNSDDIMPWEEAYRCKIFIAIKR